MCGLLYTGLWSSYLYYNAEVVHNGDKIKLRDAVGNFLKSPLAKVISKTIFRDALTILNSGELNANKEKIVKFFFLNLYPKSFFSYKKYLVSSIYQRTRFLKFHSNVHNICANKIMIFKEWGEYFSRKYTPLK